MDRRQFLTKSTTFVASIPFLPFPSFSEGKILSPPKTNKFEFKIGKIACTIFRDYDFQYQAKDFFVNANERELSDELKKYHVSGDNIASPFIALLLEIDQRKIL